MQQQPVTACEQCGYPLTNGQLLCPGCRSLVHRRRLEQIAYEASLLESADPAAAAIRWREALVLLPPEAPQYQQIRQRIGALEAGWRPGAAVPYQRSTAVKPPDPLPLAFAKTAGSMLFAAVIYYLFLFHDWVIAFGFVVLMLVHEMGHVIAMWYFRLSASPPIFIPFIGALINMREAPPNALVESIVGMGGPLLGTIGALACYVAMLFVHDPQLQFQLKITAYLAFMLNLFNLLPVPPLDGGRITAAVSPWLWIPGLIGLGALMVREYRTKGGSFGLIILALVLFYALPRIRATLSRRGTDSPYYRVSRGAAWAMGILYIWLGALLSYMFFIKLDGWRLIQGG